MDRVGFDHTTKDAADILGVTPARVYGLIAAGALPARKAGGMILLARSDIEFYRSRRVKTGGRPYLEATAWELIAGDVRHRFDDLDDAHRRLATRAKLSAWYAHPSTHRALRDRNDSTPGGRSIAARFALPVDDDGPTHLYTSNPDPAAMLDQYAATQVAVADANLVVRAVTNPKIVDQLADPDCRWALTIAALDLCDLGDRAADLVWERSRG